MHPAPSIYRKGIWVYMKKLVSICFACMLLTCAAGAANAGTIDNGYPGDTEAQARLDALGIGAGA